VTPLFLTLACTAERPDLPAGPNLLLITVDTLRADHLGAWGYDRPTSPNIDALASRGLRFSRAYSPRGSTWPALTTMMTSLHPVEHGVRQNNAPASDALTTLAEVLSARGYLTHALLTNAHGAHWEGFASTWPVLAEPLDANAAEEAGKWLAQRGAEPWFLWVHLTAPHDPYVDHPEIKSFLDPAYTGPIDDTQPPLVRSMFAPPNAADTAAILARYDSEVAAADAAVGSILAALDARGLASQTLVVLSADHGEELAEHPPYLFHFMSPWDAVLHVPLVATQPERIPAGKVFGDAVGLIDVAPTVLDWLGVPVPAAWQGRSVARAAGGGELPPVPIVSELSMAALIVHEGPWAFLWNPTGYTGELAPPMQRSDAGLGEVDNRWPLPRRALFDVLVDPRQQRDRLGEQGEVAKHLESVLDAFRARTGWPGKESEPAAREVQEQLERLGYTSNDLHGAP
jgi:arylsulfatase A-like enzyme